MSSKLKIITVVGARPQFIKAAAVSRAISSQFSNQIEEKIIHTGQHFDENMSQVFFDELVDLGEINFIDETDLGELLLLILYLFIYYFKI